jgi:hypothetical protein
MASQERLSSMELVIYITKLIAEEWKTQAKLEILKSFTKPLFIVTYLGM